MAADYDSLKSGISSAIKSNGAGEITGSVLQEQLLDIVDTLNEGKAEASKLTELESKGGIDAPLWGIPLTPLLTKEGFIILDGTFQENNAYTTALYKVDSLNHVLRIQEYGSGFYSYGECDENLTLIKGVKCISSNRKATINSFIPSSEYMFLTSRTDNDGNSPILCSSDSGSAKIAAIDNNINDLKVNSLDSIKKLETPISTNRGYFTMDGAYKDDYNYFTDVYEIGDKAAIKELQITGYDSGAGIITYGFLSNNELNPEYLLNSEPMRAGSGVVAIDFTITDVPTSANFIAVTRRRDYDKSLYIERNVLTTDILKNSFQFRVRVINHSDSVKGTEFTDNNVSRTFPLLQVIRKYNSEYDLMVCVGLNGPNGMFGLRGWRLLPNNENKLSDFPSDEVFTEMGETIGPWKIQSVNNPINNSGQQFTGGFHHLIDPTTNTYFPSASNKGFAYFADNQEIHVGEERLCNNVEARSLVNICSYNTYSDGKAREVLQYKDTYTFEGETIKVFARFTALEDIIINLHYGLQTDKFNPTIAWFTDNGIIETDTSVDSSRININQLPTMVYAQKNDGNRLNVKMYDCGAMTGNRTDGMKAFQLSYGAGNTKVYHWVYGNGKIGDMTKGQQNFYAGVFSISDKDVFL